MFGTNVKLAACFVIRKIGCKRGGRSFGIYNNLNIRERQTNDRPAL